jgi:hypothetical protein
MIHVYITTYTILGLWCLTPLSIIFESHRGGKYFVRAPSHTTTVVNIPTYLHPDVTNLFITFTSHKI